MRAPSWPTSCAPRPASRSSSRHRAPLRVSGEQEYPVPGLPVPPDPRPRGRLRTGPARRRRRRGSHRPRPALDLRGGPPVHRPGRDPSGRTSASPTRTPRPSPRSAPGSTACRWRSSWRPRASSSSVPDAILARLEHQLNLLAAGARDLPARQQTLRGAIAWSYDILDDPHRRLLDRLSVFAGGFDLEAAEAIGGPSSRDRDGRPGRPDGARRPEPDPAPGRRPEPRFQLLETIREFAAEMLESRDDATRRSGAATPAGTWRSRSRAAPGLAGADQRRLLEQLEREHDNVRAVLDRAGAAGDASCAINTAFAMWRFWQKRGHLNEARRRLEAIAAAPWSRERSRPPRPAHGGARWRPVVAGGHAGDEGRVRGGGGDRGAPRGTRPRSPTPSTTTRLRSRWTRTEWTIRTAADPDGEGARAQEEALALYEELGDLRGQANVLWGIGNSEYFQRATDAGEARMRRAFELFRQVGDTTMAAWSQHMLGGALLRLGRTEEARPILRDALRHFHGASDASALALVLDDLASQAVADGDLPRAARIRGAARRLAAATGATLANFVDTSSRSELARTSPAELSPEDLARYQAEGAAMTLDEVVAYRPRRAAAEAAPRDRRSAPPAERGYDDAVAGGRDGRHVTVTPIRLVLQTPVAPEVAWSYLTEPDRVEEWFTAASPVGEVGEPYVLDFGEGSVVQGRHRRAGAGAPVRAPLGMAGRRATPGDPGDLDRPAARGWRIGDRAPSTRAGTRPGADEAIRDDHEAYWSGYLDDLREASRGRRELVSLRGPAARLGAMTGQLPGLPAGRPPIPRRHPRRRRRHEPVLDRLQPLPRRARVRRGADRDHRHGRRPSRRRWPPSRPRPGLTGSAAAWSWWPAARRACSRSSG